VTNKMRFAGFFFFGVGIIAGTVPNAEFSMMGQSWGATSMVERLTP